MLLNQHFKQFSASQEEMPEEVRQLKELIGLKDEEIETLRQ